MCEWVHLSEQAAALPVLPSSVHGSPSSQDVGHGLLLPASHSSPGSRLPSPQRAEQSLSVAWLQVSGQHPSPDLQEVIGDVEHFTSQVAAEPVCVTAMQVLGFEHVPQLPSHFSPGSTCPSPQRGAGGGGGAGVPAG